VLPVKVTSWPEAILASADVWDMTLPWVPPYWDLSVLARYKRAGYTFVSATLVPGIVFMVAQPPPLQASITDDLC